MDSILKYAVYVAVILSYENNNVREISIITAHHKATKIDLYVLPIYFFVDEKHLKFQLELEIRKLS